MVARGHYPVTIREKLRLETTLSSHRHLSASLPLISLFLPPSPFFLFPLYLIPPSSFFFLSGLERSLCTPARNLSRKQVESSGSWMSLRGSLSALQPQEHFPSSATAAGCREEDEDEQESGSARGAEKQKRRE